jgi:hypothetical protein
MQLAFANTDIQLQGQIAFTVHGQLVSMGIAVAIARDVS